MQKSSRLKFRRIREREIARALRFLTLALMAAVAACNSEGTGPLDPSTGGLTLTGGRGVTESISGSGHYVRTDLPGVYRTFSFHATKKADETVKGEFQLDNDGLDLDFHGDIVCFTIVGNEAWVGAVSERTNAAGYDPPQEHVFRIVDNGQGDNFIPDQVSTMPLGDTDSYCQNTPLYPALKDVLDGNIQIRQ
jgi:hypothetical protein